MLPRRHVGVLIIVLLALLAGVGLAAGVGAFQSGARAESPAVTTIDVLALDRDGRFVDSLGPTDFTVTVDGRARPVLWVRRVSRGPAAAVEASSRQAAAAGPPSFTAEPRRNVLVVVDQSTLLRGDERSVFEAASAFLDRLGIEDRIAVVRVPTSPDTQVTLATERPVARAVLSRVVGQAMPGQARPADDFVPPVDRNAAFDTLREKAVEPERATVVDRQPPLNSPEPAGASAPMEPPSARTTLAALRGLLEGLQGIPGRKVVALFSAGLLGPVASQVEDTAAAASLAHASIYAFGLRGARDDPRTTPDLGAVQTLARLSGGTFVMLGRRVERTMEGTAAQLSAVYVLGIEAAASDTDGRRHALRVESWRKALTVRAGAWLSPGADAEDEAPPAPPVAATVPVPSGAAQPRQATDPAREAELRLALARLYDYAGGYERQYSMLVAEEDYRQRLQQGSTHLRSDLLLVRSANQWVSFRDVFEVDGRAVRDREDRLKRLFLDPSAEASARLQAITDESSRHNVGPVVRTVNVPLFPLTLLKSYNRPRFEFTLAGEHESSGVQVWSVEFVERARPTLVTDLEGWDVPLTGWFLVDQATGAIVETGIRTTRRTAEALIIVRYRLDQALGLWVPAQMREFYKDGQRMLMDGVASYTNFRRFQVGTEEKIVIPK